MIEKVAAAKARSIVDAAIAEAARTGMFPSSLAGLQESAAAALAMWSMMHGLTMLTIDDFVGPAEDIEIVADSMLGAMLDGIASNPPKLSRGRLVGTASLAKTPKAPPPGISRHAADGNGTNVRSATSITSPLQPKRLRPPRSNPEAAA